MQFKNVSPFGDLEVDGVGLVEAGATFEATGEAAERLLEQETNFERVDKPSSASKDKE